MQMASPIHISYLFDPLCGWCYGASPMVEKLAAEPDFTVTLVPTGLFSDAGARPMDAVFAAYAWANDQRIERLTGQPFSNEYRQNVLGAHGGRFDSAPATLALTAVHVSEPEREFEALKAIQHARYVDGVDITDTSVLAAVLRELGLEDAARRISAPGAELLDANRKRVDSARETMRRFGLQGVPSLIVGQDEVERVVSGNALFGGLDELLFNLR
jgi:putative protein-disulfide isomerase